jgi:hypothetical protein
MFYKAPEVGQSETYDVKADSFSFGALVYRVLDNKRPFKDMKEYFELTMGSTQRYETRIMSGMIAALVEEDPKLRPFILDTIPEILYHLTGAYMYEKDVKKALEIFERESFDVNF